jgi:hypothetical protein
MKKLLIPFAIVVVAAVGVSWYAFVKIPQQVESKFLASLPPGIEVSYENYGVNVFSQEATLSNFSVNHREFPLNFTANTATFSEKEKGQFTVKMKMLYLNSTETNNEMSIGRLSVDSIQRDRITTISKAFRQGQSEGWNALILAPNGLLKGVLLNDLQVQNQKMKYSLSSFSLGEFGNRRIDDIKITKFVFETKNDIGSPNHLKISDLKIDNLPLLDLSQSENILLKQFTSGDVNIGEIQITGIDYLENNYKGTREVIVDNVELKSTEIAKTANGTNYPKFIKLTVQGAKVPLAEFPSNSQPKIKELIQADTIGINFGIQFDADHTNNSASANISLGAKRLGDVNLSVSLVNVPKNLYELGTSTVNSRNIAIKQLLKQGKLSDITIGYEEKGGVARMLEMQAKEEGTSPHKLTEKMIIIAQSDAKKSGSKQEQEIAEQLAVFLRNPKSLSINSKPIQPIALQIFPEMFLFDRGKLTELLDIKVVVNK